MRAAVLAGGLGMRLRPYTTILPKPLVPINDRPILELIFAWLAGNGVVTVDVCVGHLGQLIQTYFSQAQAIPPQLELRWQYEGEPLGTAGALRSVPRPDDTLLVINGDVLTDLDLAEMLAFHRSQGAALTIASRRTEVGIELGVMELDGGLVSDYHEKPVLEYSASMGIYLYEPRALDALPAGPCQFPELVLALLARGDRVAAYENDAAWHHIGTPEQHYEAVRLLGADPPA